MIHCYESELGKSDGRCDHVARYEARLTWTNGPMFLCADHAAEARATNDVMSIRNLRPKE